MFTACRSFFYCLSFVFIPCSAQWNDSFPDADFNNNPSWTGDTSQFEVNAALQLHLNATAVTSHSYLVTASSVSVAATWKFWLQMDFNPSSSNYAKIYLISDNPRPDSTVYGYYLRIGNTGDDISLYRQDGSSSEIIIDGRNGMLNASVNKLSVLVTRSGIGDWTVSCDTTGQKNYSIIGSTVDSTYLVSRFFGIQCIYTSTRSKLFLFDDFEITGKASNDSIPPRVTDFKVLDDSVISVEFTEPMNEDDIVNINSYSLSIGKVNRATVENKKLARLYLSEVLPCKNPVKISISGIADISGNVMADTSFQATYCPGNTFEVVITEIMAKPDPPVKLPNTEYLELYNRSGTSLHLMNWVLQVGNDRMFIPEIELPADSFLILCSSKGCSAFNRQKFCLDILPTSCLNNSGEYIGLRNRDGKLIHWVNYSDAWYKDDLKKSGGWSLEMIDSNNPCVGKENWKASNDYRGGSPWGKNSEAQTISVNESFDWRYIDVPDDSTIRVHFTTPLEAETIQASMFETDQSLGGPAFVRVDSLQHQFADLIYASPFSKSTLYTLHVSEEVTSCSGDRLSNQVSIPFMVPSRADSRDVIVNEVLFNALPSSSEFVELYNNSSKFLSSAGLKFAYRAKDGEYEKYFVLGDIPFLIAPGSFLVVTNSMDGVKSFYHLPDERPVVVVFSFPALSNDEGCIAILNSSLQVMDEFCYSEKMHSPLIVNKSGVSLERMRYGNSASDWENWHSASSTSGYATPAAVNSQFLGEQELEDWVKLENEIFSPDNDGYKDVEIIHYNTDSPGYIANIIVFDALGHRIRILANNKSLGTTCSFTWDGVDEKGRLAPTGIYLIYSELHHPSGKIKQFRNTCVLGGELKR